MDDCMLCEEIVVSIDDGWNEGDSFPNIPKPDVRSEEQEFADVSQMHSELFTHIFFGISLHIIIWDGWLDHGCKDASFEDIALSLG